MYNTTVYFFFHFVYRKDICQNVSLQYNMFLCRGILSLLRKDAAVQNPYRNSLYMNYNVYQQNIPICETKKIIIPAELSKFGRTSIDQTALNCFGRSLIISESDETPLEDYQYFKEISINYGTDNSLFVFQCQKNTCVVLEHYQYEKWSPELIFIYQNIYYSPVPVKKNEIYLQSPVQETLLAMWYLLIFIIFRYHNYYIKLGRSRSLLFAAIYCK